MFSAEQLPEVARLIVERTREDRILLDQLVDQAKSMKSAVRTIRPRSSTSVALTAADGGNNKFEFNPFCLQVVRVVDSSGKQLLLDVVSPTSDIKEISRAHLDGTQAKTPLGRLMRDLDVADLRDLSPVMTGLSASWVQVYRDLCEWATLYDLMVYHSWGNDTLVVRDGLLRSKMFSGDLFIRMYDLIKTAIDKLLREDRKRMWLVGLAKHTNLLETYRLAISLAKIFERGDPCYVEVPQPMLEAVYKWEEYYRNPEENVTGEDPKFNMGRMHLVRFGARSGDPVWTVDLLESQKNDHQTVFGALLNDAKEGFPVPYYPLCLQNADRNSRVADLDMAIVQDKMLDAVRAIVGSDLAPIIDQLMLATDVSARRYG